MDGLFAAAGRLSGRGRIGHVAGDHLNARVVRVNAPQREVSRAASRVSSPKREPDPLIEQALEDVRPRNPDAPVSVTAVMDQQSVASAHTQPVPVRLVIRHSPPGPSWPAYPNHTARAAQRHELMRLNDVPLVVAGPIRRSRSTGAQITDGLNVSRNLLTDR